ncbi:DUF6518 family protein [Streptomyces sp. NPDC088354]|uniref:DUF6518 family protein n=1 Tax=unclassified Streptomyces TaxID=2593676 RepID=UPI0029B122DC|nr:DUF6518 family protein [Streptomyces sp. MI02-7b]MDX3076628.1 hypothetical protein [Streptomyces sp. MI02-7b]
MKITAGSLVVGLVFGAATSLADILSSPFTTLGMPLHGTIWAKSAKVLSLLMDSGWCWAALAVAMGWLAATPLRGAVAGPLALIGATMTYFVTDAVVGDENMTSIVYWLVAGVLFGPALGATGAAIRKPGLIGMLAALAVPMGAAAQMIVMPPRPHFTVTPSVIVSEVIVWTAAILGTGWALYRFWAARRTAPVG